MSLVAVVGKVSHLNRISSTSGGGGGGTDVSTSHQTTLRVDGRHLKVDGPMSWAADDDYVAIVGEEKEGVLEPLAIRNDTSGYEGSGKASSYGLSILLIVVGVIFIPAGLFTIPFGAWLIWGIKKREKLIAQAKQMLHEIPRA
jgi:hypothetical protein